FRREITVPLRDVGRVRQSLLESGFVIIDLARDSELGRRIRFIPKRAQAWAFQQHPIVDHLRDAVADAKKADGPTLTARGRAPTRRAPTCCPPLARPSSSSFGASRRSCFTSSASTQ